MLCCGGFFAGELSWPRTPESRRQLPTSLRAYWQITASSVGGAGLERECRAYTFKFLGSMYNTGLDTTRRKTSAAGPSGGDGGGGPRAYYGGYQGGLGGTFGGAPRFVAPTNNAPPSAEPGGAGGGQGTPPSGVGRPTTNRLQQKARSAAAGSSPGCDVSRNARLWLGCRPVIRVF